MNTPYQHIPVLLQEVLNVLDPRPGEVVLDATLGLGGHAAALLDRIGSTSRLLGIERTADGLEQARRNLDRYRSQVSLVHGDFRKLDEIAAETGFERLDCALFDLGLASWQVETGYQGLSFQIDQPLDMRLSPLTPQDHLTAASDPTRWTENAALARLVRTWRFRSAAELLVSATAEDIDNVLHHLGGVRRARQVAASIVAVRATRPLETTSDLVAAVGSDSPGLLAPVFQALRILVTDEYGALTAGIPAAWQLLGSNGRIAVITFQGTEDRIVKQILRSLPGGKLGKPIRPSSEEVGKNPRSRSATLRSIRKL